MRARSGLFLFLALVGCALAVLAGCEGKPPHPACADPLGCVDIGPGEPVKFGVLQALSGKVAALGIAQVQGVELAIAKRGGKLFDHAVTLRTEDSGCTGEGGANAALKIIADPQTVAIFGTTCSGEAATAAKVMSDAGLTMVSGNNSAPFLTAIAGRKAPHWQAGYFRTAPNEETAGKAAALYAFRELGVRKAAAINDGDIYSRGLTEGFAEAFRELGGDVVLDAAVNKGDKDMRPVLTAVLNADAELLFFPLFQPEGNQILFQARAMAGFEKVVLMSDGALIESSFLQDVGARGKGMYFVGPARPRGPEIDTLGREYEEKFKRPPAVSYYLNAYDAVNLLFAALEQAGIRHDDGSIHIGRQALRDAMYATRNFSGVSGMLSCNSFGDCATPVFNVLRLEDPSAGVEGLQANVMFSYSVERP